MKINIWNSGDTLGLCNIKFNGKAALAPLAGVADRALRELSIGYGAAFTVCEMASAKGISLGDSKSAGLMSITDGERPAGIQLFGGCPDAMYEAAKKALLFNPDFIDINMGCPVPKVISSGGGAALMKNPVLAAEIVKNVVRASEGVPVTVKIRSGWDDNSKNAVSFAKACEETGASAITVHGRTRTQMFAPPVDFDIIRQVKKAVNIPVIGNGGVTNGKEAAALLETTGCDMIMVGKGAVGSPWIFAEINAYLNNGVVLPEPPVSEKMRVMLKHIEKLCEYKGDYIGMREARKHAAWYIKGIKGAARYRAKLNLIESFDELVEIAYQIAALNAVDF